MDPVGQNEAGDASRRRYPSPNRMSFLATERSMAKLTALRVVVDADHTDEFFESLLFRAIIESEWDVLKKLMKEAGFA